MRTDTRSRILISLNNENLLQILRKHFKEPKVQPESGQVYFIIETSFGEFPVFLRIDVPTSILHIIAFLPCPMRPNAPPEIARLLHLINKEIDLPGFCLDEAAGVVFYRLSLIGNHGKIDGDIVEKVVTSLPNLCQSFYPIIASVANGVYYEAIAGDVKKALAKLIKT